MGAGASLGRLRKAVVIRSYNLRRPDQTVEEQFKCFTFRSVDDGQLYIRLSDIRNCLGMDSKDYGWIEELFAHTFGGKISEINFFDFIRFLESGKAPDLSNGPRKLSDSRGNRQSQSSSSFLTDDPSRVSSSPSTMSPSHHLIKNRSSSNGTSGVTKNIEFPPIPPSVIRQVVDPSAITIQHISSSSSSSSSSDQPQPQEEEEDYVININLSQLHDPAGMCLPDSIKLHSYDGNSCSSRTVPSSASEEDDRAPHPSSSSYSLVLHSKSTSASSSNPPKPLWRKREVVRQERTVHYTTVDEHGDQQELVEKEVTQTEVLHMECRETGEFAHRETTQYEQMESFNEEVVAEVRGAEEYVHLKSLDDEFHYMESTMPPKKGESAADTSEAHEGGGPSESEAKKSDVGDDGQEEYGDRVYADQEYGDRVFVGLDQEYISHMNGHEYKDGYTSDASQHPLQGDDVEEGEAHPGYRLTDDDILDGYAVDQHSHLSGATAGAALPHSAKKLNIDRDYLFEQVPSEVPFGQRPLKSPRPIRRVDNDDNDDYDVQQRDLHAHQRPYSHESMHDID